jgi:hypothetical protein
VRLLERAGNNNAIADPRLRTARLTRFYGGGTNAFRQRRTCPKANVVAASLVFVF